MDIQKIYSNTIGLSFYLENRNLSEKVQLIFRDIGFHLEIHEIKEFQKHIQSAFQQERCNTCELGKSCRSILLKSPSSKVSIAVSLDEIQQIEDLIDGTLFYCRLENYLNDLCKN